MVYHPNQIVLLGAPALVFGGAAAVVRRQSHDWHEWAAGFSAEFSNCSKFARIRVPKKPTHIPHDGYPLLLITFRQSGQAFAAFLVPSKVNGSYCEAVFS